MMFRRILVASLLSGVCLNGVASAQDLAPLPPSTAWEIHVEDNACVLRRSFTDGGVQATLELSQQTPTSSVFAHISAKGIGYRRVAVDIQALGAKWPFLGVGGHFDNAKGRGVYASSMVRFIWQPPQYEGHIPAQEIEEFENTITGFEVKSGFNKPLALQSGPMHKPLNALRDCVSELTEFWGFDLSVQRNSRQHPFWNNRDTSLVKIQARMPESLLKKDGSGMIAATLKVDPSGRAIECYPQTFANDSDIYLTGCNNLMEYMRFDPAKDDQGNAVTGAYTTNIKYSSTSLSSR